MPTIRDVAKRAGVAPITASRVINNTGYASEDVRRRVRQAADELGYTPNAVARSLRSNQTHALGVSPDGCDESLLDDGSPRCGRYRQ